MNGKQTLTIHNEIVQACITRIAMIIATVRFVSGKAKTATKTEVFVAIDITASTTTAAVLMPTPPSL